MHAGSAKPLWRMERSQIAVRHRGYGVIDVEKDDSLSSLYLDQHSLQKKTKDEKSIF